MMWTRGMTFCAFGAFTTMAPSAFAATHVEEHVAAEPRGNVEINNLAGSVELRGWDKPQVEVTGSAGEDVERVSLSGDPAHIVVQVITRQNRTWGSDGSAHLIVHVPVKSSVSATLVSADFSVGNLMGDLKVQSVSGELKGEVGGDLRAGSVSGNIDLRAPVARNITVKSVSGDITLTGGSGETEVTTISGTVKVEEATQTRAHFKSVSGDVSATLDVAKDGQIDAESVSGDVKMYFATAPAGDFNVESISGDIDNCFGPEPVSPKYGPGSRLTFANGEGSARVHVATKSGNVNLCTRRGPPGKPSA